MRSQKEIFLESEGNAWLERNRHNLGHRDPVSDAIKALELQPSNVLEIGCANGWRLANLRDRYGCSVMGIEPSMQAGIEAAELRVPVMQGTASSLPFPPDTFDLIIFGFCLYLTDPGDWLRIAAEADNVLKEGGHIIIHDFETSCSPYARWYEHADFIVSYHIDWPKFWLAHPSYQVRERRLSEKDAVTTLKKLFSIRVRA